MLHTIESLKKTGKVTYENECWIWNAALAGKDYPVVRDDRERYVHRLVFLLTHGYSARPQAAHACGQARCFNPEHIYQATQKENEADKVRHGTIMYGEKNKGSKIGHCVRWHIRRGQKCSCGHHIDEIVERLKDRHGVPGDHHNH